MHVNRASFFFLASVIQHEFKNKPHEGTNILALMLNNRKRLRILNISIKESHEAFHRRHSEIIGKGNTRHLSNPAIFTTGIL